MATYGPGIDQSQHMKSVSHIIRNNISYVELLSFPHPASLPPTSVPPNRSCLATQQVRHLTVGTIFLYDLCELLTLCF